MWPRSMHSRAIAHGCRLLLARPRISIPLLTSHAAHPVRLPCRRCGIPAANATYSSTVPPGGCITSCDNVRNRTAIFIASGKAVPFMAGLFDPKTASGGSGRRRLLSVWANYTYGEASLACSLFVSKTAWQVVWGMLRCMQRSAALCGVVRTGMFLSQTRMRAVAAALAALECSTVSTRALIHCQPPRLKLLRPAPRLAMTTRIVSTAAGDWEAAAAARRLGS